MKIAKTIKGTVVLNKVTNEVYMITEADGVTAKGKLYDMGSESIIEDGKEITITEANDIVFRGIKFPEREVPSGFEISEDKKLLLKDGESFTEFGDIKVVELIGAYRSTLVFTAISDYDSEEFDILTYDVNKDVFAKVYTGYTSIDIVDAYPDYILLQGVQIKDAVKFTGIDEVETPYKRFCRAEIIILSVNGNNRRGIRTPIDVETVEKWNDNDEYEIVLTATQPFKIEGRDEIVEADEAEKTTVIIRTGKTKGSFGKLIIDSFNINAKLASSSLYEYNARGLILFSEDEFVFEKTGMSSGKTSIVKNLIDTGCIYLVDRSENCYDTTFTFTNRDFSDTRKFISTYREDRGYTYKLE